MPLDISKLQYVIFDWDNTLAESRTALVAVVNQVLVEYGLPEWEVIKRKRDDNLSFRDNFPNIFGPHQAVEAYERYVTLYKEKISSLIHTFPGVCDVLEYFKSHNIPMIVMSNKDRRLLDIELPLLFNPSTFLRVIAGHEAPRDKPFPEHIFYSLEGLLAPQDINPDNTWMMGDSSQDSDCALAANANPIRIGQPIWGSDKTKSDKIIYLSDFKSLLKLLSV